MGEREPVRLAERPRPVGHVHGGPPPVVRKILTDDRVTGRVSCRQPVAGASPRWAAAEPTR
jgi:hypothetical protein